MFDPASLTYDANGLIPVVAQDHASGEVLMLAWMNDEAGCDPLSQLIGLIDETAHASRVSLS